MVFAGNRLSVATFIDYGGELKSVGLRQRLVDSMPLFLRKFPHTTFLFLHQSAELNNLHKVCTYPLTLVFWMSHHGITIGKHHHGVYFGLGHHATRSADAGAVQYSV